MLTPAQSELFQVTAFDPPLRDSRDVMEYPFLSIQKGRKSPIHFKDEANGISIDVRSESNSGIANIWDWDLIIYLAANINDCTENGGKPSERVVFAPYDALRYMGRSTGGGDYKQLAASIDRLYSTSLRTTIRAGDGGIGAFRWVQSFWIPMQLKKKLMTPEDMEFFEDVPPDPTRPWMVEITGWLYKAIEARSGILALHKDYFELKGGIERWLYRLARKAVPDKADFPIIKFRMETLHKRSGSTRELRKFAADIRDIASRQPLPEYSIFIHKDGNSELVSLMRDSKKRRRLPRGLKFKSEDQSP